MVVVAIGYRAPEESPTLASAAALQTVAPSENTDTIVNDVVASNIAASVAASANLSVAPSVTSFAISTQIESELPTADDSSITKPQIIQVSAASRDIASYTVKPGDTVASLAEQFNLKPDTIKWANDLTDDALQVDAKLEILPRDGIVYTVKSGDTIQSIAEKYQALASAITTYNDLEISGVSTGLKIIIPGGVLPVEERPGYVAPTFFYRPSNIGVGSGGYANTLGASAGNRYAFGNCTWYVFERRAAIGKPIGSFWGNGGFWAFSAQASGYTVNNRATAGAILVEPGNPGHVGIVERVLANGDVVISEMNNAAYGGFNIVNNRTLSAGQAALYRYIQ